MNELDVVLKLAALRQMNRAVLPAGPNPHPAVRAIVSGAASMSQLAGVYGVQQGEARNWDLPRTKYGAALSSTLIIAVYRCCELRARRIGSLKWRIRNVDNNEILATSDQIAPKHPLARAFRDYQELTSFNYFYHWEWNLALTGENYTDLVLNEWDYPTGTYIISPLFISPRVVSGRIVDFQYAGDDRMETFNPIEIAYNRYFNMTDRHRGYSPTLVAIDELNIGRNWKRYLRAYYINNALPGLAISPPTGVRWETTDIVSVKSAIQRIRGVDNAFNALIAPEPAEFTEFSQQELSGDIELDEHIERKVHKVYGVPLAMAGDTNSATFKDGEEAQHFLNSNTIIPESQGLAGFVTMNVLPRFINPYQDPPNQVFEFDTSEFDRISEDDQRRTATATTQFAGNIASLDEARAIAKLPAWKDPAVGEKLWFQIQAENVSSQPASLVVQHQPTVHIPGADKPKLPATVVEPPTLNRKSAPGGATAMVIMGYEPALVMLQNELTKTYGTAFRATPIDQLHMTLCSAGMASPLALANIYNELDFPVFTIEGAGQLGEFINDQRTVHLAIKPTPELLAVQKAVAEGFTAGGATISDFHAPGEYIPHITLGTLKTDAGLPDAIAVPEMAFDINQVHFCRDDFQVVKTVQARKVKHWTPPPGLHIHTLDWTLEKALAEVDAWKNVFRKRKAIKTFNVEYLRGDIGDRLRAALYEANGERALELNAFQEAKQALEASVKSIEQTKAGFMAEFMDVVGALKTGRINRREAGYRLRGIYTRYSMLCYLDGMDDGGIEALPGDLDPEDVNTIKELRAEGRGYISDLTAAIASDSYSDAQLALKPDQWWGKAMLPFYTAGNMSADRNGLYEFNGDDGVESCRTCQWCKFRRHRLESWVENELVPPHGSKLICSPGGLCQHGLEPARGRATPGSLTKAPHVSPKLKALEQ